MGTCPCPRCLLPKASFGLLGLFRDIQNRLVNLRAYCLENVTKARRFIYNEGNTVDGSKVQAALGEGSWVPTVVSVPGIPYGLVADFQPECFCRKIRTPRTRRVSHARCGFHA
jgi:hypothetical protein